MRVLSRSASPFPVFRTESVGYRERVLYTERDPRHAWWRLSAKAELDESDLRELRSLPAGAREVPLAWVATSQVEQRGHFDRDLQEAVYTEHTHLTGWLERADPRVRYAGALSLWGIDSLSNGMLSPFPGEDRWGTEMSALTLPSHLLTPRMLAWIGATRPWQDLSLSGGRFSPASRVAAVRELGAAFPALEGLALGSASLDRSDLEALAKAACIPKLLDLGVTGSPLDPQGALTLFKRLGELEHLDLRDARLGRKPIEALAPKLRRARRLVLSSNPIGDAGLRALLEAGALANVEDLWLSSCDLTDASAHALAEASLPKLRGLWIDSNALTDEGIMTLIRAPLFAQLEGVSLHRSGMGEGPKALLAGHPLEGGLTGTARLPGKHALWFMGRSPSEPSTSPG